MAKEKVTFVCGECGAEHSRWQGQCKECKSWNTIVEFKQPKSSKNASSLTSWTGEKTKVVSFKNIEACDDAERLDTGLSEFNRVLNGGIPKSGVLLLSGEPGAGKSTILMQVAGNLLNNNKTVLYVSAEESLSHLKARAERLGIDSSELLGLAENQLEEVLNTIKEVKPDLVIIDSIQCILSSDINSSAGSVSQIHTCASALNRQCKQMGHSLIIVGHVTKDGAIAGPNVFKHMVDVTLKFEVEGGNSIFRSITSEKNRYGASETGFFEMTNKGLVSIENPSNIFMPNERESYPGSAIGILKKGSRNLLIEIQSLVENKNYSSPRRVATGLDVNKLYMILALNNKFMGSSQLGDTDVYASIVSGIQTKDNDIDLTLLISILSSYMYQSFDKKLVSFGEVTLTGEIRGVLSALNRIKDAYKFGFNKIIVPYQNKSDEIDDFQSQNADLEIIYVKHIQDLLNIIEKIK